MAGTRLVLSMIAVLQLVAVVWLALSQGLCKTKQQHETEQSPDLLCQRGSSLVSKLVTTLLGANPLLVLPAQMLALEPLVLMTATQEQADVWNRIVQQEAQQKGGDAWVVRPTTLSPRQFEAVCRGDANQDIKNGDPSVGKNDDTADIWICPALDTDEPSTSQLVLYAASSLFRTKARATAQDLLSDWQDIYPTRTGPTRRQIDLQLQLASDYQQNDEGNWKEIAQTVQTWLEFFAPSMQSWPCLLTPPIWNVQVAPVEWAPHWQKRVETVQNDNETTTTVLWDMTTPDLAALLYETSVKQDVATGRIRAVLHVPRKKNSHHDTFYSFVNEQGQQSLVASSGNTIVSILHNDDESAIDSVLSDWMQQVFLTCMGMRDESWLASTLMAQSDNEEAGTHVQVTFADETMLSAWHVKLWYQRTVAQVYRQAFAGVQRVDHLLHFQTQWWNSPTVTTEFSETVQQAVDLMTRSQMQVKIDNRQQEADYAGALQSLDQALALLETLERNPALSEPLDFPPEQYAAILAPLVLPLLLPLFFGVIKEVRRYQSLTTAMKQV